MQNTKTTGKVAPNTAPTTTYATLTNTGKEVTYANLWAFINNNCGEVIKNLRDNYVSNNYLSENCSDAIDKELGNTN